MKDIFRKLDRQDYRFKESLKQAHNRFYKRIFKYKRALIEGNEEIEFVSEELKQIKKPKVERAKKMYREQASINVEEHKLQTSRLLKKDKVPENAKDHDEATNKLKQIFGLKLKKETNDLKVHYQQHEREFIKGNNNNEMIAALKLEFKEDMKYKVGDIYDQNNQIESQEVKELLMHQKIINQLMTEDLYQNMKQYEFIKLIQSQKILDDVSHKLYERDPRIIKDQSHFKQCLKYSDKDLFMKFRDEIITYDQFLSRIEEKRFGTVYKVLDDMKGKIQDKFIKKEKDDAITLKALHYVKERGHSSSSMSFLGGKQCIRSIFKDQSQSQKELAKAEKSIDHQMNMRHRNEVNQRKQEQDEQKQKWARDNYQESAKQIQKIRAKSELNTIQRQPMDIQNEKTKQIEQKLRSKKFNERLKQTLKQNFEQYKREQYNQIPESSDPDKIFYKQKLASDLNITEQKRENTGKNNQDNRISQQQQIIMRRKEESKAKRQKELQMRFINRLQQDGSNTVSGQTRQILDSLEHHISLKLQDSDQNNQESIIRRLLTSTKISINQKNSNQSAPQSQDSVLSTQVPHNQSQEINDYAMIFSHKKRKSEVSPKIKGINLFKINKNSIMQSKLERRKSDTQAYSYHEQENKSSMEKSDSNNVSQEFKQWYINAIGRYQGPDQKFFSLRKSLEMPLERQRPSTSVGGERGLIDDKYQNLKSLSQAYSLNVSPKNLINYKPLDYKTKAIISRLAQNQVKQLEKDQNYDSIKHSVLDALYQQTFQGQTSLGQQDLTQDQALNLEEDIEAQQIDLNNNQGKPKVQKGKQIRIKDDRNKKNGQQFSKEFTFQNNLL
ncbi:UNKNOWN [Stylonychia lemnae]|uniref:Uncharacterized protein n=1 Tax=Stylonychia lemnae TaxID=5949 RepID=A0A078AMI0_STYLE|nr:UNKNOWN [Stylonychia lemnae]|eukprot:CDW83126.1 UNKNOWN [Stylonychia lemnae]